MSGASDVKWARSSGNPAIADATQVVCIDVKTDCPMSRWRRAGCSAGAECLGEQHRDAAMQYAHRLASARVDGRPGADEVVTYFKELDAEVGHRRFDVDRG